MRRRQPCVQPRVSTGAMFMLAVAAIAAALGFTVAVAADGFVKDPQVNCSVFRANLVAGEAVSWSGNCRNGYAEGQGVARWIKDGRVTLTFEGNFREGKLEGKGKMTAAGGDRYEGDFRDGKREGRGTYVSADGQRYEGQYLANARHGEGVLVEPDGRRFAVELKEGKVISQRPLDAGSTASAPNVDRAASAAPPPQRSVDQTSPAMPRGGVPPTATGPTSLDGDWFDSALGIGFRIEKKTGTATYSKSPPPSLGEVMLKVESTSGPTFEGQILWRGSWKATSGQVVADGKMLVMFVDRMPAVRAERGLPPSWSEPYASGARYALGDCGAFFHVAAFLPKAVNLRALPISANYSTVNEAPQEFAAIVNEALKQSRAKCSYITENNASFIIHLFSGSMPALPLSSQQLQAAKATLQLDRGSVGFRNMAALEVAQEKEQQLRADESAKAAAQVKVKQEAETDFKARLAEFRRKHGVSSDAQFLPASLYTNVFAYENKPIYFRLRSYKMIDRSTALVRAWSIEVDDRPVTLTDISPSTFPVEIRTAIFVVGTVVGNSKGGESPHPVLRFRAAFICSDAECKSNTER